MQEDAIKEDSDDESRHNPDERISSMLFTSSVALLTIGAVEQFSLFNHSNCVTNCFCRTLITSLNVHLDCIGLFRLCFGRCLSSND